MMLTKVLRVTVKNRIGKVFGNRDVTIKKNEERAASLTIAPGEDALLPDGKELIPIESLELDAGAGAMTQQAALAVQPGIPITIDSTGDYRVTVTRSVGQDNWKLEFAAAQNVLRAAAKDTSGGGDPDKVNVTLGGDEPPAPQPLALAPMFLTGAGTFTAGWFISCCVSTFNTTVWYAVPIAAVVGGIIGALLTRKKSS